jgi:IMP cyclohydrolase
MTTLAQAVRADAYPGRGIAIGRSEDGRSAVIAYFIMGRSVNSRNRVFVPDGDGLKTRAFDASKLTDPSLIIYAPVRVLGDVTIVTNGDQTDTIRDFLARGQSAEAALKTRAFEPDAPNFTPRISALVAREGGDFSYMLSILKSDDGDPACTVRAFYHYENPKGGEARFIHTYKGDGEPLPSFEGEPEKVRISGGIDAFAADLYAALDEENKVALFVRYIDIVSGRCETRIVNKHA